MSLFSGRELTAALAHEGGGEGYGRLDEVVIVRGDDGHPGPDQAEPGLPGDRGGLASDCSVSAASWYRARA